MIDHVSLRVQDFERAVAFYRAALAPLGYDVLMEFSGAAGFGAGGKADFWIMQGEPPLHASHIAFASERAIVDEFHSAAIAAGGSDNGAPGPRAHYHPNYYGAFIFDPEGNNVEVVCHADPNAKPAAAARTTAAKPKAKAKAPKKVAAKTKAKPVKAKAPKKVAAKTKAKPAKATKAKATKAKATKAKATKKRR